MIRRELGPSLINRIANDPAVRPFVDYRGVGGPVDLSVCFPSRQTGIVVLTNGEDAGGLFVLTSNTDWQIHTLFCASCRGRRALQTAREMIAWITPYAKRLWGATPVGNRAARWFNRQLGFTSYGFDDYAAEGRVELFERFV